MVNAYGPREWVIDSTGSVTVDKVRVQRMEWIPNAAADDLLVSNTAGDKIWEVTNAIAGAIPGKEEIEFGSRGKDVEGFVVTTLGGGTLYVHIM